MRVLVVHAHPVAESFNGELCRSVVRTLGEGGHEVDLLDLYAEAFEPVLTREERLGYHDTATNRAPVAREVERLEAAEALVLCFPVWNYGYPAILKGWFDRVFLPGVSFTLEEGRVAPALGNIRRLAIVTTYGGDRLRTVLAGDPPRRIAGRMLRWLVARGAPYDYLALYDMNRATRTERVRFIGRVEASMRRF